MNNYDGLFIVRPDLKEEDVKNAYGFISGSITKSGGTIKKEEIWGKKELAYNVKKFKDGYYYRLDFSALPAAVSKLESAFKLNADILRTMITKK